MVGPESPLRAWPETSSQPVIPPIARTKTAAALISGRFQRLGRTWWVVASPKSPASGAEGWGTARRRRVAWSASAEWAAGTRRARVASGAAWPRSWVASASAGRGADGSTWPRSWVASTGAGGSPGTVWAVAGSAEATRPGAGSVSGSGSGSARKVSGTSGPGSPVGRTCATSRICSPVRRKRCWKTLPPVVATTLITPAPMTVP